LGDYYPLTDVTIDARDWCVVQYHRPTEQDGMFVLFRRPKSCFASYELREVRAIEPEADYEVTLARGYVPSKPNRMKGAALRRLRVDVDDSPGSVVVEYRKVGR